MFYEKFRSSYYFLTSVFIILFNYFFYMIVQPVISFIGYHKKTDEIRLTCFTVVACLCVDMIILPIMLGFSLVEVADNKISNSIFKGKHTDFDAAWYPDIGVQITITMSFFAFQPMIDFLVEYTYTRFYRWYYRTFVYTKESRS